MHLGRNADGRDIAQGRARKAGENVAQGGVDSFEVLLEEAARPRQRGMVVHGGKDGIGVLPECNHG